MPLEISKRRLLGAAFAVAVFATAPAGAQPHPGSEVFNQEDRMYAALVARDVAALDRLLADDFALSGANGVLESRDQYLQTTAMPERTLEPVVLEDRLARVYGDAAVTTGLGRLKGAWKGRPIAVNARYTNVWILQGGAWRIVASHLTPTG